MQKNINSSLLKLLRPYRVLVGLLILFALISNAANLILPKIISRGIDMYVDNQLVLTNIVTEFLIAALIIFIFSLLQMMIQTYTSEKVGFDLRKKLSYKVSGQSYKFIQEANPSKLLTNFTSDIDSVKSFVSNAVASIVSSSFIIIGTSTLLLIINWKLALPVLLIIPMIGIAFHIVLSKVRIYFRKSREVIDWLNKVINESILGAAIIRVLNSQNIEHRKFTTASAEARDVGISIVTYFATLIPLITFLANIATLIILVPGGYLVITESLSIGDFAAFNSYVALLIFPIMVIGFMSNMIARASASYERIEKVLLASDTVIKGTIKKPLSGDIQFNDVTVTYDGKPALKNVSIQIKQGSRTAIIGPTAAGKSQLLYLLTGLIQPDKGVVEFEGVDVNQFDHEFFYNQVGFVFQDSILFNLTLRENIAFSNTATSDSLQKAIETAELDGFIDSLPQGLDTMVSERGTSLSGGQKQRIMLARALALNPKILLLDDFTARVDQQTEQEILKNVFTNYPDLTLISVTQKINPVKNFDLIILMMEGEVVAMGKHNQLLASSPEYVQIYESQKSTSHYEL